MSDEPNGASAHEGPSAFGIWVRQLRERLGWNQERLATEAWVVPSAVFYWETRDRWPNLATYKRLEALAMLHNFPAPPARPKQRRAKDAAEPAS